MAVYSVQLHDRRPLAGTIKRLAPPNCRQAMVSKDGECAVLWNWGIKADRWSIWLANTDGSELRRLTHDFRIAAFPFWTPDEKHIVFSGCKEFPSPTLTFKDLMGQENQVPLNLYMMDRDGSNITQLTTGEYQDMRPCVSPDGQTVVFRSNRLGLNSRQLWKLDIQSGSIQLVDDHDGLNGRPIFSSDGRYLAYQSTKYQKHGENLLIREWPEGKDWNPISLREHEWIHGAFWVSNDQRILFHGNLLGAKQTKLFSLEMSSGEYEGIEIPGVKSHAHGSIDQRESILVFDSNPAMRQLLVRVYRRSRAAISKIVRMYKKN